MTQITPLQLNAALDAFRVTESDCGDLIANTRVFIAGLFNCEATPPVFDLTVDTTPVALTDEAVSLALSGTNLPTGVDSLSITRGTRLYFDDTTPLIVAADAVLSTAAPVSVVIEPATIAVAAGTIASLFDFEEALNVSSASLANNIQSEDTGRTSQGRRLDSVVTAIQPQTSGDLFFNVRDRALWRDVGIFNAMQTGLEIYVYQELAQGQFGIIGRALVTSFDSTQDAQSVVTVSYEFSFQSDFVYFTPAEFRTTADQAFYNNIRRLFGQTLVEPAM